MTCDCETCLINCKFANIEGNSSHASVNPSTTTPTNTRSDANTTSVNANKDMAWEWGVQKDPLKKNWCTLCDKRVCGEITRLKEHLTHTGGNVAACTKVTTEITKKVLESMKEKDKKKGKKKNNKHT